MKNLLKWEEAGLVLLSVLIFSQTSFAWWWYPVLFFTPDIGMIGYLKNPKTGALLYNLFHHQAIAVLLLGWGWMLHSEIVLLIGAILLGHSAFDRIFGYGLKYKDSFHHTHLGRIGPSNHNS